MPLKPPRNDSFSKASPLHYKFNYSDPQYDIDSDSDNNKTNDNKIIQHKVITFNVLATCYALKSSSYHTYCPSEHLKGEYRFKHIGKILHDKNKCDGDIICLQEIDKPSQTLKWMNLKKENDGIDNEYKVFYNKRTNKKQDGLIIAYKHQKYKQYKNKPLRVIKLNDLTLAHLSENSQQYFRKDQIAMYLLLQPLQDPTHLLFIINTHLYWHPDACNIRLRQISYILNIINEKCNKIKEADNEIKKISLIFGGDFNTLPKKAPHQFMLDGKYTMKAKGNTTLKLMFDSSLNKVARWCRSLGVDCNYHSEQKMDTKNAQKLFNLCKMEERILITRSKRLVARKECPSHLLLNNSEPRDNLKQIIKYFGIEYDDDAIYTRCTLCNGYFKQLIDKKEIMDNDQIPNKLKEQWETTKFEKCLKCSQVYWVGDKSRSEMEKFKRIFKEVAVEIDKESKEGKERLKQRIIKQKQKAEYKKQLRLQRQKNGKQNEKEQEKEGKDEEEEEVYESDIGDLDDKLRLLPNLQRFFWEDVEFKSPFGDRIKSSYSIVHGKPAKYTNKTSKFEGCLDYIFYGELMNKSNNDNNVSSIKCIDSVLIEGDGQYYPNSSWPSDHILLMSTFETQ